MRLSMVVVMATISNAQSSCRTGILYVCNRVHTKAFSKTQTQYMQRGSSLDHGFFFKKKPRLLGDYRSRGHAPPLFCRHKGHFFEVFDLQGTLIEEYHTQLVLYPFQTISNCDPLCCRQLNRVRWTLVVRIAREHKEILAGVQASTFTTECAANSCKEFPKWWSCLSRQPLPLILLAVLTTSCPFNPPNELE